MLQEDYRRDGGFYSYRSLAARRHDAPAILRAPELLWDLGFYKEHRRGYAFLREAPNLVRSAGVEVAVSARACS